MMRSLARLTVAGFVLLGAVVAIVIWSLSNANKPHEIKGQEVVLALLAIGSAIAIKVIFELVKYWRIRHSVHWRLPRLMLVIAALMYVPVVLFLTTAMVGELWF